MAKRSVDPRLPVVVTPVEVVMDLIDAGRALNYAQSTWVLYRASMLWHLAPDQPV